LASDNAGCVELPYALREKYPSAPREWPWQWVFPATRRYVDRSTSECRRHHLHETVIQRAVRRAAIAAGSSDRPEVLNPRGEIVGVLSSIVHDVREVGIVALPESPPDYYSISTLIDDPTRDVAGLALGTRAE
jgi:hypothetical protein